MPETNERKWGRRPGVGRGSVIHLHIYLARNPYRLFFFFLFFFYFIFLSTPAECNTSAHGDGDDDDAAADDGGTFYARILSNAAMEGYSVRAVFLFFLFFSFHLSALFRTYFYSIFLALFSRREGRAKIHTWSTCVGIRRQDLSLVHFQPRPRNDSPFPHTAVRYLHTSSPSAPSPHLQIASPLCWCVPTHTHTCPHTARRQFDVCILLGIALCIGQA